MRVVLSILLKHCNCILHIQKLRTDGQNVSRVCSASQVLLSSFLRCNLCTPNSRKLEIWALQSSKYSLHWRILSCVASKDIQSVSQTCARSSRQSSEFLLSVTMQWAWNILFTWYHWAWDYIFYKITDVFYFIHWFSDILIEILSITFEVLHYINYIDYYTQEPKEDRESWIFKIWFIASFIHYLNMHRNSLSLKIKFLIACGGWA